MTMTRGKDTTVCGGEVKPPMEQVRVAGHELRPAAPVAPRHGGPVFPDARGVGAIHSQCATKDLHSRVAGPVKVTDPNDGPERAGKPEKDIPGVPGGRTNGDR